MEKISGFKELRIWQAGIVLAKLTYAMTRSFPKDEAYGLASQMKRAAVSVPSNIAEGSRRQSTKELIQFLRIALGSLGELETQTIIAFEVGLITKDDLALMEENCTTIARGIVKLQQSLKTRS